MRTDIQRKRQQFVSANGMKSQVSNSWLLQNKHSIDASRCNHTVDRRDQLRYISETPATLGKVNAVKRETEAKRFINVSSGRQGQMHLHNQR